MVEVGVENFLSILTEQLGGEAAHVAGGMIEGCLQMMWNEGPGDFYGGHGHYINMSSTQYTKVSCGYYTLADGSVWATQDFQ